MKKRLFISSILMTLVLLVAITTATFAWYSAGNAGIKVGGKTDSSATVSSSKIQYQIGSVEIPGIKIKSVSVAAATLELAHFNDASATKKLSTGYYTNTFHELGVKGGSGSDKDDAVLVDASHALFTTVTVTLAVDTTVVTDGYEDANHNFWTAADLLAALNGKTLTVTAEGATGSRARCFAADGNASAASDSNTAASGTVTLASSMTTAWEGTITFNVYIYGGAATQNDGTTDVGSQAILITLVAES